MSDAQTSKKVGRRRILRRCSIFALASAVVVALSVGTTVWWFVRSATIISLLADVVAKQTGARLTVESADVSLRKGVVLRGLAFRLPLAEDGKGFLEGGPVQEVPAIVAAEVRIDWDTLALVRLCLCVSNLSISGLDIRIKAEGGGTTLDGVKRYRDAHPSPPEPPPTPSPPLTLDAAKGYLAKVPPGLSVHMHNVGVLGLRLDIEPGAAKNLGLERAENGIQVDADTVVDFDATASGSFDLKHRIVLRQLKAQGIHVADLHTVMRVGLDLDSDLLGVKVREVHFDAGDIVAQDLSGAVRFDDETFQRGKVSLHESLKLHIGSAEKLWSPFVKDLKAQGDVLLESLRIEGPFTFQPMPPTSSDALPLLETSLRLVGLEIHWPAQGLHLEPFNFDLKTTIRPDAKGVAAATATWNGSTNGASWTSPKEKNLSVGARDFTTSGEIAATYPALELPHGQVLADVEKLDLKLPKVGRIEVPFKVKLSAKGDGLKQAGKAEVEVAAGSLVQILAAAEIADEKRHAKANWDARIESLRALYALLGHLDVLKGKAELPEELGGKFRLTGRVEATLPKDVKLNARNPLLGVRAEHDTHVRLEGFSTSVASQGLSIKDLDVDIEERGNLKREFLKARISLGHAALKSKKGDGEEGGEAKSISLSNVTSKLDLGVDIDGTLRLDAPETIGNQVTAVPDFALNIGQVSLSQDLPITLNGIELILRGELRKAQALTVKQLMALIPGAGARFAASGEATLGPGWKPSSLEIVNRLSVKPSDQTKLQKGLSTSGSMEIELKAKSADMKVVQIHGGMNFDSLSLRMLDKEEKTEVVSVEGVNGQFPFAQIVDIEASVNRDVVKEEIPREDGESAKVATQSPSPIPTPASENPQESSEDEDDKLDAAIDRFLTARTSPVAADRMLVNTVSFQDVRPFFSNRRPITIKKVRARGFDLSDIEINASVSQNWLSVHEFMLGFLGGKIQGDFHLSFTDTPISLRTDVHLTRLNTHRLVENLPGVKEKAQSWVLVSNPYIDGTLHLNYDFPTSDMSGGVEITSIGQEQMKMLLYYIDPDGQNPTISDIKKALNIGEVRQVSVPLKSGQIGLDVDVRLLKAPLPTPKLQRFPIAQLVDNFKSADKGRPATGKVAKGAKP